jgi:hypothetical protein
MASHFRRDSGAASLNERRIGRSLAVTVLIACLLAMAAPALAGDDSVGVVDQRSGVWYLRDATNGETTSFYYGNPGDYPFMGDWDCDGVDTPGLYRQSDGYVYLRNSNDQGVADIKFFFGNPGDIPIAGDFDNDGCDTVSVYRPSQSRVFIINELGSGDEGLGAADKDYLFGDPGDVPFVGDFDNDMVDTIGLYRASTGFVYFRNTQTTGTADSDFFYGDPGDRIIAGRWAQNGTPGPDTVGIFRPGKGTFFLRFSNTQGEANVDFQYGNRYMAPVAGIFGDLPGGDPAPPEPNPEVYAIGDSVMLGASIWLPNLEGAIENITVNATVSRQFSQGDSVLASRLAAGHDPGVVIIGLGTNGPPTASQFADIMKVAGSQRRVLFITVRLDRSWESQTNKVIRDNVKKYPNAELVDWFALSDSHPEWFDANPGCYCHLWETYTRQQYVNLVAGAVDS